MSAPVVPRAIPDAPRSQTTHVPLIAGISFGLLAVDQLTKIWARAELDDRIIDVVWKLRLRLVLNPGTAFSLGEGIGPVLGVVAIVVVIVLARLALQPRSLLSAIGISLLLGGAAGNVIDRAVRSPRGFLTGHVVDFIDFQFWPVFNVADMGVTCGVVLVLAELQRASRAEQVAGSDG